MHTTRPILRIHPAPLHSLHPATAAPGSDPTDWFTKPQSDPIHPVKGGHAPFRNPTYTRCIPHREDREHIQADISVVLKLKKTSHTLRSAHVSVCTPYSESWTTYSTSCTTPSACAAHLQGRPAPAARPAAASSSPNLPEAPPRRTPVPT